MAPYALEVKQVTDLAVYLGTLAGALLAIGAVARYALLRPLKRWLVEQVSDPVAQISAEVVPTSEEGRDGPTLRDVAVETGFRLNALEQRFEDHMRVHHNA